MYRQLSWLHTFVGLFLQPGKDPATHCSSHESMEPWQFSQADRTEESDIIWLHGYGGYASKLGCQTKRIENWKINFGNPTLFVYNLFWAKARSKISNESSPKEYVFKPVWSNSHKVMFRQRCRCRMPIQGPICSSWACMTVGPTSCCLSEAPKADSFL